MTTLMERKRDGVIVAASDALASPSPTDEIMAAWTGGSAVDNLLARPRPLRVLIIDDNRDAADSLSILVKVWGHDPGVAYDGAAGLATAAEDLPDVVLVDIGMPKLNGFQLAQQLRRQVRFADTLLVAITGWADQAHRWLWEAAFDQYLIKPVAPLALEKLLRDRACLVRSRIGDHLSGPTLGRIAAALTGQSHTTPDLF